jgi:hypothetical protein
MAKSRARPNSASSSFPSSLLLAFPLFAVVGALAALFRGKFLAGLAQMLDAGELHLPDSELKIAANRARWFSLLYTKRWVYQGRGSRSRGEFRLIADLFLQKTNHFSRR